MIDFLMSIVCLFKGHDWRIPQFIQQMKNPKHKFRVCERCFKVERIDD